MRELKTAIMNAMDKHGYGDVHKNLSIALEENKTVEDAILWLAERWADETERANEFRRAIPKPKMRRMRK